MWMELDWMGHDWVEHDNDQYKPWSIAPVPDSAEGEVRGQWSESRCRSNVPLQNPPQDWERIVRTGSQFDWGSRPGHGV